MFDRVLVVNDDGNDSFNDLHDNVDVHHNDRMNHIILMIAYQKKILLIMMELMLSIMHDLHYVHYDHDNDNNNDNDHDNNNNDDDGVDDNFFYHNIKDDHSRRKEREEDQTRFHFPEEKSELGTAVPRCFRWFSVYLQRMESLIFNHFL